MRLQTKGLNDTMPAPDAENPSPADEIAKINGAAADGESVTAAPSEPDPFKVLENLNAENAALKDRVLRTMADMENLRRRTEKEVADAKLYGVSNFAREMLNVVDNLRRAVTSVPAEAAQNATGPLKTLVEGVELTEKDFLSRLARVGVKPLDPQGKRFDPNMHEALYEIPNESVPSGTVLDVVEAGYSIGDRVLRPAKVGVSRGGPRVAAEQAN
jgi:molecular chaperone GrpE